MEFTIYDKNGTPQAYFTDNGYIYLWNGKPVAHINGENIYNFNGKRLGWFEGSIIYNSQGLRIGFLKETCPTVTQVESVKSVKQVMPVKSVPQVAPVKPTFSPGISETGLSDFLEQGD